MIVLAIGNAFDGLTFVGPFGDMQEAIDYAENHARDDVWHIVNVLKPAIER